jgi:hypothetical protein
MRSPYHPSSKNNSWILVWGWGCHGPHLHYAYIVGCPCAHQVCSKLWYFMWAMKMCYANLYLLYCDPKKIYTNFQCIMDCTNDKLLTTWWTNPTNIISVSFFIFKVTIWIHYKWPSIGVFAMCTCDEWYVIATTMKLQCYIAIPSLIKEFVQRSPSEELMNWCY